MERHYDYREDPEIFSAACLYDRFNDVRAYDKIQDSPVPFYDLDVLGMREAIPNGEEYDKNIQCYHTLLYLLFRDHYIFHIKYDYGNRSNRYYSDTKDFNDVLMGTHLKLINSFFKKLEDRFGSDFDTIVGWLEKWVEVTFDIASGCFDKCTDSKDIYGNPRDNLGIYELVLKFVQQSFHEIIVNLSYGPYVQASKIMLYNFWGDSYERDIKNIQIDVAHTDEESQKIDWIANRIRFDNEYALLVCQALAMCMDIEPQNGYLNQTRRTLQYLFSDYTKRLKIRGIHNREALCFASRFWQYNTSLSIRRIIEIELQKYRLKGYLPGDILHGHEFRLKPEYRRKYDALRELCSISLTSLDLIDFYIRDIREGSLKYPWADVLASFDINYYGLYERMKLKNLIAGIEFERFKYAFESGEWNILQDNTNKTSDIRNNTQALKRLIQWMMAKKDRLSKEDKKLLIDWGETAAHSLKNRDGNTFDLDTILKATNRGAIYVMMDEILAEIMRL